MKTKILFKTTAAVVTFAAFSSIAWADEPKPDCEFPGGAYYDATNTLRLESFTDDSAKVEISNEAAQCVNSKTSEFKLIVARNTALAANSTIVLPANFKIQNDCVKLYEPVEFSTDAEGNWSVTASHLKGEGDGNKPMLMITDTDRNECQDIKDIEFTGRELRSTEHAVTYVWLYNNKTQNNDWSLEGTYSFIRWEKDNAELGMVYGYAAKEKGKVTPGQFVQVGSNAYIPPLRAYLKYIGKEPLSQKNKALAKTAESAQDNGQVFALPKTIDVHLIEDDGTTSLAKWNTATGEIKKLNHWYDLKGRKFQNNPTNNSVFINKVRANH
jgi:hypothetical protein